MTEQKVHADSDESTSKRHPNSEAHQVISAEKKQSLSTPWKVALSMLAVFLIALVVVLKVGLVTPEREVFNKPVVRERADDQSKNKASASTESSSSLSEPSPASATMEQYLKQPKITPTGTSVVSESKRQVFDARRKTPAKAQASEESRAPQQEAAQGLNGSVGTVKITRPEHWIVKIQGLIKEGEQQRAAQEIKNFKRYYPDIDLSALGIIAEPN
jgi:hypothetical protein